MPQPTPPRPGSPSPAARVAAHGAALALCAVALFFIAQFLRQYGFWLKVFDLRNFLGEWRVEAGGFDLYGLLWGGVLAALCTVVGWYYLEGLELYIPRKAALALSFTFGLGLVGLVLEWLAIPFLLSRQTICGAVALLLALLAWRAARRHRARPEADASSPGGDVREHFLRRRLAREAFQATLKKPRGLEWFYTIAACALLIAITFADFWHALLYPEVYWDSLILYLGYARMTFLEHGFPVKVTGQVGIGLGANYPHVFAVLGAGASTLAGAWSELPQRLITPLAGAATTLLVYQSALRLARHVNFALAVALLWRCAPMGIQYDQVASDYALTILFGAAFLYLALLYIETALRGYCAAAALLIALAMHLNYLMGILWLPWAVMMLAAHFNWREPEMDAAAPWTRAERRPPLTGVLLSWWIWPVLIGAGLVGSTWLARNWIVTGNPVYAFFYKQLGGENINPDVMAAAAKEWFTNGAGIGRMDEALPEFSPLAARLRGAWYFFVNYKLAYLFGPMFMAFAVPGALAWLGGALASPFARRARRAPGSHDKRTRARFGWVVFVYAVGLLVFHFTIAPYYLYQIVMILPGCALLAALAWPIVARAPWRAMWGGLALVAGLFPGLAMALMGFKVTGAVTLGPERYAPWESLYVLRHPLPAPAQIYAWRYGADALMFQYLNSHLAGQKILTHENRHLVFDPTIRLVHLDDWDMQALWKLKDPSERVRQLRNIHGIQHYLCVPNELNCATNERMGTKDWPGLGLATLEFESGENKLYRLVLPEDKPGVLPMKK